MPGPDGKLTAREVLVFPETARGTREGYSAWDFGANSTMTNANVDTVVQGTSGRNLGLGGFKLEVASPSSAKIDARYKDFAMLRDAGLNGCAVVILNHRNSSQ